jgi:hypothetical protein
MNIRHFVLAIFLFAAGCLFTAALGSRSLHLSAKSPEPAVAAQTTPERWEYRAVTGSVMGGSSVRLSTEINNALIQLGQQGFDEVVWSEQNDSNGYFHVTLLLRRPKP